MSNATQTLASHLEQDLGFYLEQRAASDGGRIYARRIADIGAEGTTTLRVNINDDENQVDVIDYEGFLSIAGSATFRGVLEGRQAIRVEAYIASFLA